MLGVNVLLFGDYGASGHMQPALTLVTMITVILLLLRALLLELRAFPAPSLSP